VHSKAHTQFVVITRVGKILLKRSTKINICTNRTNAPSLYNELDHKYWRRLQLFSVL